MIPKTKQQNKKIPKLRFSGFSEKWEEKRLGDLIEEVNERITKNNQYEILSSSKSGIYLQRDYFNKQTASYDNVAYKIIKKGMFTYRSMSDTGNFTFNLQNLVNIGIVSPTYPVFKTRNNRVESVFLYYYLNNVSDIKRQILRLKQGGTRFALNFNKFKNFKIEFPLLPEQQKIAGFLRAVDERIEILKKKREGLEKYKKGIMQKIFPAKGEKVPQIRFKDDNGKDFTDWKEKRLGEICKITTGKLDANTMTENGKYRFYTCAKEFFKIDNYAFDTEALLISGNGANVGYIHYYKGKFNAYQRTYVLDQFSEHIIYIKYFLEMFLKEKINREKKEGNTPYIVLGTLSGMKIKIPLLSKQQKIASFLSAIDKKIELVDAQIQKIQGWKRGLMQELFV